MKTLMTPSTLFVPCASLQQRGRLRKSSHLDPCYGRAVSPDRKAEHAGRAAVQTGGDGTFPLQRAGAAEAYFALGFAALRAFVGLWVAASARALSKMARMYSALLV